MLQVVLFPEAMSKYAWFMYAELVCTQLLYLIPFTVKLVSLAGFWQFSQEPSMPWFLHMQNGDSTSLHFSELGGFTPEFWSYFSSYLEDAVEIFGWKTEALRWKCFRAHAMQEVKPADHNFASGFKTFYLLNIYIHNYTD